MLYGQYAVVAYRAQGRYKIAPELLSMTVAECAVSPHEIAYRLAGRQVERSLSGEILRIDSGIFGMDVANGVPQSSDDRKRVHSLEKEVAWIEVHGGGRSDGSAQAHK